MGQNMSTMVAQEPQVVEVCVVDLAGNEIARLTASECDTLAVVEIHLEKNCGIPVESQQLVNLSGAEVDDGGWCPYDMSSVLGNDVPLGWLGSPANLQLIKMAQDPRAKLRRLLEEVRCLLEEMDHMDHIDFIPWRSMHSTKRQVLGLIEMLPDPDPEFQEVILEELRCRLEEMRADRHNLNSYLDNLRVTQVLRRQDELICHEQHPGYYQTRHMFLCNPSPAAALEAGARLRQQKEQRSALRARRHLPPRSSVAPRRLLGIKQPGGGARGGNRSAPGRY